MRHSRAAPGVVNQISYDVCCPERRRHALTKVADRHQLVMQATKDRLFPERANDPISPASGTGSRGIDGGPVSRFIALAVKRPHALGQTLQTRFHCRQRGPRRGTISIELRDATLGIKGFGARLRPRILGSSSEPGREGGVISDAKRGELVLGAFELGDGRRKPLTGCGGGRPSE